MLFDDLVPAVQQKNKAAARNAIKKITQVFEQHRLAIDEVVKITSAEAATNEAKALEVVESSTYVLFGIFGFTVLVALLIAYKIARSIMDSADMLSKAVAESEAVIFAARKGDLTQRIGLIGKSGAVAKLCVGVNSHLEYQVVLRTASRCGRTGECHRAIFVAIDQRTICLGRGNIGIGGSNDGFYFAKQ